MDIYGKLSGGDIPPPKIYPREKQLEFIASHLPEPLAANGCPAYSNRELLPGILKLQHSECRCRDLYSPYCTHETTHWRRLQFWKRKRHFRNLWELLLKLLHKQKLLVYER